MLSATKLYIKVIKFDIDLIKKKKDWKLDLKKIHQNLSLLAIFKGLWFV
jgi:hypothetical protein